MTLQQKITNGLLNRATVEKVLAAYRQQLAPLEAKLDTLKGFQRDSFVEFNGFQGLNRAIENGEKILATMTKMGV